MALGEEITMATAFHPRAETQHASVEAPDHHARVQALMAHARARPALNGYTSAEHDRALLRVTADLLHHQSPVVITARAAGVMERPRARPSGV
jgi:hypothetical protein